MKRLLFFFLMCLPMMAGAQVLTIEEATAIVIEKGVLEQKSVVIVDGVNKNTLYRRAMEALSDWTGPEGRSKAGIDYSDKEEGIVTYKGVYYNGYRKLMLSSLPFYTDFTLKVRCKDGKAQIAVTVPSMHTILDDGSKKVWSMREIVESQDNINPKKLEKAKKKTNAISAREIVYILLQSMESALKKAEDDDF